MKQAPRKMAVPPAVTGSLGISAADGLADAHGGGGKRYRAGPCRWNATVF